MSKRRKIAQLESERERAHAEMVRMQTFIDELREQVVASAETMPDTNRSPTEADRIMAGMLSTIWPMCHRHPEEAIHLAIFVNDHADLRS